MADGTNRPPVYAGIFLDRPSRDLLLGRVPPKHGTVFADHLTLAFGPALFQADGKLKAYPVGFRATFFVEYEVDDERGQAVACTIPDPIFLAAGQVPHVTISCADGTGPSYSNHLVKSINPGEDRDRFERFAVRGVVDFFPRTYPASAGALTKEQP